MDQTSWSGKMNDSHPSSPFKGVHLSFALYKIIEASSLCFNYFSVAFLFFVPLIDAHGTPPYATCKDQQFIPLLSLQNPFHILSISLLFSSQLYLLYYTKYISIGAWDSILCVFLFQYSQRAKIFPNLYRTYLYWCKILYHYMTSFSLILQ